MNRTYVSCNNTQQCLLCECILIEMFQNKCWFCWFFSMITIKFQKMYSSSPIIFISTTIVLVRFILVQCVLFKVALRDQKIIALEMTHELTLLILFTFGRIFSKLTLKSSTWHIGMRKENLVYLVNNSKTIPQKFNVIRTGSHEICFISIFNISP